MGISERAEFTLIRFNQTGSIDLTFGLNGKVTTPFLTDEESNTFATVLGVALEPNGRLVAAGSLSTDVTGDFVLARYYLGFTLYDACVQDDGNDNLLRFNIITSDYEFANCEGLTIDGIGLITRKGALITLQDFSAHRRVLGKVNTSTNRATASIQLLSQKMTFTITDRDISNNTCSCQ